MMKRSQPSLGNEIAMDVKLKVPSKELHDENVWRIEEVDCESGDTTWSGLMSIYC